MDPAARSPELLQRWHEGDATALPQLLSLHLGWLQQHVAQRLGPFLRRQADADDYVQDVVLEFLRDGPRFQVKDDAQLRRLLARVVENTLRDKNDWFRARRRDLGRNEGLPNDSVLCLDAALANSSTPSRTAARVETREWVRLALELMAPEDRKIILSRNYDRRSFEAIAAELGMKPSATRMRWTRAVARLAEVMRRLQAGSVDNTNGGATDDGTGDTEPE